MRFTIRNLVLWTLILGIGFGLGRLVGLPLGLLFAGIVVLVLISYEDGLSSAGIEANKIHEALSPLPDSMDGRDATLPQFRRGTRLGPGIYLLSFGFLGIVICSIIAIAISHIVPFVLGPLAGCAMGGLIYRQRSRDWPIDPGTRIRQMKYSVSLTVLLPLLSLMLFAHNVWFALVIGFYLAAALTAGIFASGQKRDGTIHASISRASIAGDSQKTIS